ncbi:Fcf2 pre-rRNA processing protein [Striga asiatica]|uniref:Fcf2 pre-rRNA processing protein n=1 Tax=Striga asiatica TaxID=4170 RepID=A0A5A7R8N4_STRAF|nr:Fcf2 pre-rRNA processing protein [Striga asiatica]
MLGFFFFDTPHVRTSNRPPRHASRLPVFETPVRRLAVSDASPPRRSASPADSSSTPTPLCRFGRLAPSKAHVAGKQTGGPGGAAFLDPWQVTGQVGRGRRVAGQMSGNKTVVGLSWEPNLAVFSSTGKEKCPETEISALYKPNSELVDGLFLPPNDPRKLNKLIKKQVKDTAGKNWFDMPAQTMTPELKKDLQLLKVGTVIESATEFFTGRLTKKERKATLADELLADSTLGDYRKRKVREIEEANRPAGVDKWKRSKSKKHAKGRKKVVNS